MPVIKCKMCGGDLNIVEDSSVCECEYCGTKQTVPKVDDEKKLKLFSRAGKLLRSCEFDKASGVFESIIADFPEEAEAYWGLILCKYGIEYVDDPATGKKVPTCHRSSFESVEDDSNYEQACENADPVARRVYREEARQIETLRKRILEVSGKEEPYDVFISYKELDEDGDRTPDSVIAQDIYRTLTKEGYRVFFSRISLEGKLGVEYEPYIFAALNSAKVMIVVGTDYEYFDAVWVKNEWSRFLKLIASGQQKTVIPVYKDMDPYDMPKELRALAAQNMGKIGAMQDLLHGVEKLLGKTNEQAPKEQPVIVQSSGPNVGALLDRGIMALEDGDWDKAKMFFDQTLNIDSRCGEAFLGLSMAEAHCADRDKYAKTYTDLHSTMSVNRNVIRARKFSSELSSWFTDLDSQVTEKEKLERMAQEKEEEEARIAREKEEEERIRRETDKTHSNYQAACEAMQTATKENSLRHYRIAASYLSQIVDYKNSTELLEQCRKEIDEREQVLGEELRRKSYKEACDILQEALKQGNSTSVTNMLRRAAEQFRFLGNYQDSAEKALFCMNKIPEIQKQMKEEAAVARAKAGAERIASERKAKIDALIAEKARLSAEMSTLKGLFAGKRRKEIEARLSAIDKEIKK